MSDITYSKRADELLAAPANLTTLAVAQANATLAVARALREVDEKLRYAASVIADSVKDAAASAQHPETWVVWVDDSDARHAQNVDHIRGFREEGEVTAVLFDDGTAGTIPLSFGAVAFQVGA